jgi:tRNA nucleotidyltransferase (CCA-adding enzyme)
VADAAAASRPGAPATFEVGGAVRDALLGLPVNDRDWVVVGATPERMVELGFRPVGRDFPVFLHPVTHEEYALARTERKNGRGYRGFVVHCAPDVTLEEDLRRRDLTINAMARAADGSIVDPWGGRQDLHDRVLRHVSEAFAEDPVRVLRLARFAARFDDFSIAPETHALMRAMVAAGEVDALVPERVWQELARGLGERTPSRMLRVLRDAGALARLLPELDPREDDRIARGIDGAAAAGAPLAVRVAVLLHRLEVAALERACARLRVPNDCRDLARQVAAEHARVVAPDAAPPAEVLALLERCDAIRKPARFDAMLAACEVIHRAGTGRAPAQAGRLAAALRAAREVDAGAIAAQVARQPGTVPVSEAIRAAVHAERERAVQRALAATGSPEPSR